MYQVAVQRVFVAYHYLVGGDWGPENQPHAHHYRLELVLMGENLDSHGFLVDILAIEALLNAQVTRFRDQVLNTFPEFAGLNPSIEHFSRILCQTFATGIQAANISRVRVRLWENEIAWAAFEMDH